MSSKTPTKQQSASKKTPIKSTHKKQQSKQLQSNTKEVVPKSNTKNINLIEDMKQKFLQSQVVNTGYSSKDLQNQLKNILTLQGIQAAALELTSLITAENLIELTIYEALSKLNAQNINALVYLIDQILSDKKNKSTQNLSVWIHAIWKTNSQLVFYNQKIKQYVHQQCEKFNKNNEIQIIKGKLSLLTGF